ncbi:unnamed protein product, partial [Rotaria sordida]
MLDGGLDIP